MTDIFNLYLHKKEKRRRRLLGLSDNCGRAEEIYTYNCTVSLLLVFFERKAKRRVEIIGEEKKGEERVEHRVEEYQEEEKREDQSKEERRNERTGEQMGSSDY